MPAWITSELRDEVTVPIASAASRTITSRPAWARRRATARPITPAPITTHSTLSIRRSDPQFAGCSTRRVVRVQDRSCLHYRTVGDDVFAQPAGLPLAGFAESGSR